jgi:hypothetical protein
MAYLKWGVHGTCIRPFAPDCSPDGIERGSEVSKEHTLSLALTAAVRIHLIRWFRRLLQVPTYFLLAHALQQSLNTAALLEKEDVRSALSLLPHLLFSSQQCFLPRPSPS